MGYIHLCAKSDVHGGGRGGGGCIYIVWVWARDGEDNLVLLHLHEVIHWAGLVLVVKHPKRVMQRLDAESSWSGEVNESGAPLPGGGEEGEINLSLAFDEDELADDPCTSSRVSGDSGISEWLN